MIDLGLGSTGGRADLCGVEEVMNRLRDVEYEVLTGHLGRGTGLGV